MEKIKKFFSKMTGAVKSAFHNFPITIVLIFIYTLMLTFREEWFNNEVFEHITIILCLGIVGTVFSEILFPNNNKKYIGGIISFVISIGIDRVWERKIFAEEVLARWVMFYCLISACMSVYLLSKKSDNIERYILNTFLNIKRNSIIYGIVLLGVLILYAIFCALIGKIEFEYFTKFFILFSGWYYAPVVLNSFIEKDAEDTKFNKTLFTKVFLILLCAAMVIVYAYIFKLIFVTGIPENEVFMILSWIFACMFPICVINKNYLEENKLLKKATTLIPILYIPFIILQIYTMGIRILDYGITEERYLAIMLIIFEIAAIFLITFKNSKYLRELAFVVIGIGMIALITPFNYQKVAIMSQEKILAKYANSNVKLESLEIGEQRKYAGAYQYLEYKKNYRFKVEIDEEEKKLLSNFSNYRDIVDYKFDSEEQKNIYANFSEDLEELDITEYSRIYRVDKYLTNYSSSDFLTRNNKFLKTIVTNRKYNRDVEVDFTDFITKVIEKYTENSVTSDRIFSENNLIRIDDNTDVYVESLNVSFERETLVVNSASIDGYVLERK